MSEEYQVTNHLRTTLHGRFDAQDYVFKPEEPVSIPRVAARHIFGLGEDNKTRALAQLGILKAGVSYQEALAVLRKVSFAEGHMVYEAQQQGPGGGQQSPPGQKPEQQPGHQPGQHPGQKPDPDKEKRGPGKDEEDEESQESGGTRPGAPKGPPGRKSEAGDPKFSASDDLDPAKRKW